MAMNQQIIDRYKAQGFYKHIEWNRRNGVLIKLFDKKPDEKLQTVSFEAGFHDKDYDQVLPGFRQFFYERREAVRFMLNMGFNVKEIANVFRQIDNEQVVFKHI